MPNTDGIKREDLQIVAGISKRFQNDFPLQIDLSLKIWRILRDNMITKGERSRKSNKVYQAEIKTSRAERP